VNVAESGKRAAGDVPVARGGLKHSQPRDFDSDAGPHRVKSTRRPFCPVARSVRGGNKVSPRGMSVESVPEEIDIAPWQRYDAGSLTARTRCVIT